MQTESKHEWLSAVLKQEAGRLDAHAALPTERQLTAQYGVSRATVRTALQTLEAAGVVYRVQGAGTFVSGSKVSKTLRLTSFTEDMHDRGITPGSRVIAADEVLSGIAVANDLQITPDDPVLRLVRLRLADDEPMCLETTYLASKLAPNLLAEDLSTSLYDRLDRLNLRPVRAEQLVRAIAIEGFEAGMLAVPPGSAALRIDRVGFDHRGRAVERTESIYRGDRYNITFAVLRDGV